MRLNCAFVGFLTKPVKGDRQQHIETYLYLSDFLRALKPGGTVVFSFLDFGTDHH